MSDSDVPGTRTASTTAGLDPLQLEVVVAHYNEDLDWLEPLAPEAFIYTKGMT